MNDDWKTTLKVPDSPKVLRETLCAAHSGINFMMPRCWTRSPPPAGGHRSRPAERRATMPHDQVPKQPVCWPVFLLALNRLTAEWYAAHRQRWVIGMIREPVQQTETRPEPAGGEEVS